MAKPHPFFLVLGFLLLSFSAVAAPTFSPQHKTLYQQVLQLKVEQARKLAKQQLKANPGNAISILLDNYTDFFELCVQQDAGQFETLLARQEERLEKLESLPQDNAWSTYASAEVGMQIGMSKLLFGNRLSAAWDLRNAYQQYSQNAKRYPDLLPNLKNLGVMQVLIGSVPDQYKWFLDIIGLKGNVRQGMQNLKKASAKENPFNLEAQLLHTVLLHMTQPEQELQALDRVQALSRNHKQNLLATFVAMHLLKKSKQGEAALQVYRSKPNGTAYLTFPYLHHMAADLYLFKGNYDKSVQENRLFLEQHTGQHYLKSAHFKLYLAYALGDHAPQASWYLQQISQKGIAETEEDKYADRYVEKQEALVKPLMQARLHSDGGYYTLAMQRLEKLPITSTTPSAVQAEHAYRKARILHGQELPQQAVPYYKKTIALCKGTNLYFAPNAALQLGYIYQQQGQAALARTYFKQALHYKNHPYKNSIDAKAKLALSTM